MLGSCYGSTGPGSVNPETGEAYGPDFPLVSIRDNVRGAGAAAGFAGHSAAAAGHGRVHRRHAGAGVGDSCIPSAWSGRRLSAWRRCRPWGWRLNHLQRQAIQKDPDWDGGYYLPQSPPRLGLALARQIAMLSYKSAACSTNGLRAIPTAMAKIRGRTQPQDGQAAGLIGGRFDIAGYLDHQGKRFIDRFDANAYLAILRTMETWDPMRGCASR